jgi:acyl dehydratase
MSWQVGDALPPFTIESVSPEGMRAWAVFLADPNPIHLDPQVVKAKGLGDRVINQGPANVAYVMNMLMAAFPGGRIEAMDSRFLDNVYGGDKVTASGTVTGVADGRVMCDFTLDVDGRGPVNSGTAVILTNQGD